MAKKRGTTAKKDKTISIKIDQKDTTEKILIENFVALQKVMTVLAAKFGILSDQISKLLELFEISAKEMAERGFSEEKPDLKIAEKLNNLIEQNKVIARGVAMLYENNDIDNLPTPEPVQRAPVPIQQQPSSQIKPMQGQKPTVDFSKIQKFENFGA
jgi:hypothetical protein